MKIELYNSDNLEIMAKMPDESIDIICIDPPYINLQAEFPEKAFEFIGTEIDLEYFDLGKERIDKIKEKKADLFKTI